MNVISSRWATAPSKSCGRSSRPVLRAPCQSRAFVGLFYRNEPMSRPHRSMLAVAFGHSLRCFTFLLPFLIATQGAQAGGKESKERAAKTACQSGDAAKGVALLAELYVDTNDITFLFNQGRCFEQRPLRRRNRSLSRVLAQEQGRRQRDRHRCRKTHRRLPGLARQAGSADGCGRAARARRETVRDQPTGGAGRGAGGARRAAGAGN